MMMMLLLIVMMTEAVRGETLSWKVAMSGMEEQRDDCCVVDL